MKNNKINKALCCFGVLLMMTTSLSAATLSGEVFSGVSYDDENFDFDVSRAQFGAEESFSESTSGKILFDVDRESDGSLEAQLLNAYIENDDLIPNISIRVGLQPTQLFEHQEEQWGYQYVAENALERYDFGEAADFGVTAFTNIADQVDVNVAVLNGDGYTSAQDDDGDIKIAVGASASPIEDLKLTAYYDMTEVTDLETDSVMAFSAGYDLNETARLGLEYNLRTNIAGVDGTDRTIISAYGSYSLTNDINIFARADLATFSFASVDDSETTVIIAGAEYSLAEDVKAAVAIHSTDSDDESDTSFSLNTSWEF